MECCSDSPPLYGYFLVAKIELTLASKVHYLNLPQPMYKNIEEEEKAQVKLIEIEFLQFVGGCQQNSLKC